MASERPLNFNAQNLRPLQRILADPMEPIEAPIAASTSNPNDAIGQYSDIRAKFLTYSANSQNGSKMMTPIAGQGVYQVIQNALSQRVSGFDKFFSVLVQGIIDDPDYALRKDPLIYGRMARDPQIYYTMMVRKAASAGLPWIIKPPTAYEKDAKAINIASEAERRIRRLPRFTELLDNILEALLPGLSVNELIWTFDEQAGYIIKDHCPVNKDRIKFDKDGNPRLLCPANVNQGIALPPYKFITHTFNVSDGSWKEPTDAGYIYYGKGLADTPLYHYFYFKTLALKFYLQSLERGGSPAKILYTGAQHASLANKLHEIMLALKNDSVVTIPGKKGEVSVDVVRQVNNPALFLQLIEYIDRAITRCILGQELMTEMPSGARGSYAAAQVHQSVFAWVVETDKNLLKQTLNDTLMAFDAQLNTPDVPKEMRPIFDFKQGALEDPTIFLNTVQTAVNLGLQVSEAQVRETIGLREPQEGEGVINMQSISELQQASQPQMDPNIDPNTGQPIQQNDPAKGSKPKPTDKPKSKPNDKAKPSQKQVVAKPTMKDKSKKR
jgi:phage gp29-like protein